MVKKMLKIFFISLLLLVVVALIAPFIFKDKIILKIKSSVNKNIDAKADFTDANISMFRHFPRVSVALENLQVIGVNKFEKDTLFSAKSLDIALNLVSVIKGDHLIINSVNINAPRIHAIVDKDGNANWNITKSGNDATDTSKESKPFQMELQHYAITNGYISYDDKKSNISSEIINLNHEGSGDFTSDVFMLKTSTKTDAITFTMSNIPYLAQAKTSIDADIQVNNKTNTYQFETGNIKVNNLQLATKGFVQMLPDSSYNMDVSFNAPSTDFKNILSLVPSIYKHDFDKIKTKGAVTFNGFVKGTYSNKKMPAYNINFDVKNGFFQYPDLPKPVNNINLSIKVDNPDGVTDHTVVNIPQGHFEMDKEPFDFRFFMKNPVSDMFIDAAAKGKIDLSNISQFVKLESGTKLAGLLRADILAKGALSAIEKQQYEQFIASGSLAITALQYASTAYPDGVKVNNLFLTFNPKDITVSDFDGQYKKTNFSANGSVSNVLPYVLKNKTLSGSLHLKADKMNVNDWMGTTADTASSTAKNTPSSAPFAVPANLDVAINAEVGRVLYDKLEIQQLTGKMTIKDETVTLNNIAGSALDGTMVINGTYSTKENKKKPAISLHYDVKGLDVEKTFYTFNTVQKLMPVGQFIAGKLSSQLNMNGSLGDNMMPDLSSLTGEGDLLLIEGFLKKFAPLDKLADLFNIDQLKEISMKDVKNHIEFAKGKVLVKPFNLKVKDIDMQIGGMQGIDQTLDYIINLKIPRVLMGDKGNNFINSLVSQVNQKGIPLKLGETVNVTVKMGGTIKNPTFKTDLKEAAGNTADELKQQAVAFAQSKIDSSKKTIRDTLNDVKKDLEITLQEELKKRLSGYKDTVKGKSNGTDSSRKRLEDAGRGLLQQLLKPKKADSTKQ
jgi:hypothetical protein